MDSTTKETLDEYYTDICKAIDMLVSINNKIDYNEDYDKGYNDAAVAIKNTIRTIKFKLEKNR